MNEETEADRVLEKAKGHVRDGLEEINKLVMRSADGTEQYTEEYKLVLWRVHIVLLKVRDDLRC